MSDKFFRRTWAQVDLDALKHNFEVLRSIVPDSAEIMGIVKADAYGHGVEMISKTLCDLGVDRFGVSSVSEAEQLRSFGIKKPVLILGYTPCELAKELPNVYVSTCAAFVPVMKMAYEVCGPEKMIFSSDAPFGDPCQELEKIQYVIKNPEHLEMILYGNAKRIMNL